MLRQVQTQKLLQKLSPQQIQLMKMLQLPTVALEQRIKEEMEINPEAQNYYSKVPGHRIKYKFRRTKNRTYFSNAAKIN